MKEKKSKIAKKFKCPKCDNSVVVHVRLSAPPTCSRHSPVAIEMLSTSN